MLDLPTQPPTQSPLTAADVHVVRALLTSRPALLPIELIDIILDEAEYWSHSTVEVNSIRQVHGVHESLGYSKAYLVTLPLAHPHTEGHHTTSPGKPPAVQPCQHMKGEVGSDAGEGMKRGKHPCRRIVFELHSRDQGWSDYSENHGTYDRTRSWFDVSVVRDFSSLLPPSSSSSSLDTNGDDRDNNNVGDERDDGSDEDDRDPDDRDRDDDDNGEDDPHGFIFAFGLLPPSAPADSATNRTVEAMSDRDLQRNVHAKAEETRHVIVWDWKDTIKDGSPEALEAERMGRGWRSMDGGFVRGMKHGDQIALWMNAIERGWVCRVSRAIVTIYWAV